MEQESSTFDYCFFASFQVLSLSTIVDGLMTDGIIEVLEER